MKKCQRICRNDDGSRYLHGSNIITMMPGFIGRSTVSGLTFAPATTSGWFLPSTGLVGDMIANRGGDVASTMKEWQTSGTYRVDYAYCSATVGYDVLVRRTHDGEDSAMRKRSWSSRRWCLDILLIHRSDSEAVWVETVRRGTTELYINWYDGRLRRSSHSRLRYGDPEKEMDVFYKRCPFLFSAWN